MAWDVQDISFKKWLRENNVIELGIIFEDDFLSAWADKSIENIGYINTFLIKTTKKLCSFEHIGQEPRLFISEVTDESLKKITFFEKQLDTYKKTISKKFQSVLNKKNDDLNINLEGFCLSINSEILKNMSLAKKIHIQNGVCLIKSKTLSFENFQSLHLTNVSFVRNYHKNDDILPILEISNVHNVFLQDVSVSNIEFSGSISIINVAHARVNDFKFMNVESSAIYLNLNNQSTASVSNSKVSTFKVSGNGMHDLRIKNNTRIDYLSVGNVCNLEFYSSNINFLDLYKLKKIYVNTCNFIKIQLFLIEPIEHIELVLIASNVLYLENPIDIHTIENFFEHDTFTENIVVDIFSSCIKYENAVNILLLDTNVKNLGIPGAQIRNDTRSSFVIYGHGSTNNENNYAYPNYEELKLDGLMNGTDAINSYAQNLPRTEFNKLMKIWRRNTKSLRKKFIHPGYINIKSQIIFLLLLSSIYIGVSLVSSDVLSKYILSDYVLDYTKKTLTVLTGGFLDLYDKKMLSINDLIFKYIFAIMWPVLISSLVYMHIYLELGDKKVNLSNSSLK